MPLPDSVRKILGPILTLVLLVGIAAGIGYSFHGRQAEQQRAGAMETVRGLSAGVRQLPLDFSPFSA